MAGIAPGRGSVKVAECFAARSQAMIVMRPAAPLVQSQACSRRQRQQPPELRCLVQQRRCDENVDEGS
jgi:hypothetical protein